MPAHDDPDDELATSSHPRVGAARAPTSETHVETPARRSSKKLMDAPDFGPRYRPLGILGKGGMGEVYRAYDAELGEDVALKVVKQGSQEVDFRGRFRREIMLARKVTSRNVLRVYDLAEHAGLQFLSMEYIDGESLATLMAREGRLSFERAIEIFVQICKGLIAAHEQGVMHRDLKPHNVLVHKTGRVVIADFGLARSIGDSGLTASGAILGSPMYMSPEQIKGDEIDVRSDIYSLGVMLYQMLTGKPPFEGATAHALMEVRLHKKPRPLRAQVLELPAYIEQVVARCMELDPAHRYATVAELLADVQRESASPPPRGRKVWLKPAIGGSALVVAGVIAWIGATRGPEAPREPQAPQESGASPAPSTTAAAAPDANVVPSSSDPILTLVLGIANRTGDPTFESGPLDAVVVSALRRSRRLWPMGHDDLTNAASALSAEPLPIDDNFGKVLATRRGRHVLNLRGNITRSGDKYKISIRVTNASDAAVVFESSEVSSRAELVRTMGRLTHGLRAAAGEDVAGEDPTATDASNSIEVMHDYAMGLRARWGGLESDALLYLERAVSRDPSFTLGHQMLGIVLGNLGRWELAKQHRKQTLRSIDRVGDWLRLTILAESRANENDFEQSIEAFEMLLARWPDDLGARGQLAIAYGALHRVQKELETTRELMKITPLSLPYRFNLATAELAAGNFAETLTECERGLSDFTQPYPEFHELAAIAELLLGNVDKAKQRYQKYADGEPSGGATALADLALARGELTAATKLLSDGIAIDVKENAVDKLEAKQLMLAELRLRRGDRAGALAAASKVTLNEVNRTYAALVQLAAGGEPKAMATATWLAARLSPDARAFAKLVGAEGKRLRGKSQTAILAMREAIQISDHWLGHFLLARAYLDAGQHAEAFHELTIVQKRTGEIVFTREEYPGVRYVPQLTYYRARAQQELGSPAAAAGYRAFIALHPNGEDDSMVLDAKKRLAELTR